jgi:hypothetical protein
MTPHRNTPWELVAYGALGLVVLAMSKRPVDAEGDASPRRVPTTLHQPPNSEDEVDRLRAGETGRGRQATSPWRIPWRGWKDILWRAYEKMNENRLLAVAGGIVFYALLALFPAVTAFVSLYGLVADASTIGQHLSLAAGILPSGAVDILHEQLTRLTANRTSALSFGFVFGLLFALWSANSGTKAVIDGLNVAYGEIEKRSFIRLNILSLVFTLSAFLALTLAVGSVDARRGHRSRRAHPALAYRTGRRGKCRYRHPPLARGACLCYPGACDPLSLRPESARGALDLAFGRQRRCGGRVARRLCVIILVHRKFRNV